MADIQYLFLPYLRRGLSRFITEPSNLTNTRASIPTSVQEQHNHQIKADIKKDISLYGPQDVIGINKNMISRIAPQADVNLITAGRHRRLILRVIVSLWGAPRRGNRWGRFRRNQSQQRTVGSITIAGGME